MAKLFTRPANLFILDEPTNDLDVETLEILETMLVEISATVIIISHDRAFLDNCCSELLVFDNQLPPLGKSCDDSLKELYQVIEITGGYQDWKRYIDEMMPKESKAERKAANKASLLNNKTSKEKKLSYKDQKELDELPAVIEKLEQRVNDFEQQLSQPDFYNDAAKSAEVLSQFEFVKNELDSAYASWDELEAKKG